MSRFTVRKAGLCLILSAVLVTTASLAAPQKQGGGGHPGGGGGGHPGGGGGRPGGGGGGGHAAPHFSAPARAAPHFSSPSRPAFTPRAASRPAFTPRSASRPQFQRAPATVQRATPNIRTATPQSQTLSLRQQRQAQQGQQRIDRAQQRIQALQGRAANDPRAARRLQAQQRTLDRLQTRQSRFGNANNPAVNANAINANRISAQAARQGRFAGRFQGNAAARAQARRAAGLPPRQAWRRGYRAAFTPWLGPVFWPYAYSDIFEYAFWPDAYDDAYWAYAYDDFFDGVFMGGGSPYGDYAYAGGGYMGGGTPAPRAAAQAVNQVCKDPGSGITAWPFAKIEQTVQATDEQRVLLDDLKTAAAKAADDFKSSCGDSFAMTPPGRLQAMENRIDATINAVNTVAPALGKFYDALSDEQKARFNAMGPNFGSNKAPAQGEPQEANTACNDPKTGLTSFPIERIQDVVQPNEEQKGRLDKLSNATQKAVDTLQTACPNVTALTPVGRLDAMKQRLKAMSKAAHDVQPALDDFYASLSNEQKARFNTLGSTASR